MFAFVRKVIGARTAATPAASRRPTVRRRLECEPLEDRWLLSLAGPEIHVNTRIDLSQNQPAVASSSNGRSVVVWTDQYSTTDKDIRAQRYDASGNRLGGEIIVVFSTKNEYEPAVAMDAQGNFVVVWTEDFSATDRDVKAQRFSAGGAKVGGVITVANLGRNEYDASVAMAANGDFVVSYTLDAASTGRDVMARMFSATGTWLRTLTVSNASQSEFRSSVARAPDGRFAIAWQTNFAGTDSDIQLYLYGAPGNGYSFHTMDGSSRQDMNPSVAMDNAGNVVVVYQALVAGDYDIKAMRISSSGGRSGEFTVAATRDHETDPVVALHPTNGRFVVAYNYRVREGAVTTFVHIREVSASNGVTADFNLTGNRWTPAISMNGSGRYMVVYASSWPARPPNFDWADGIFAQFGQLS